MRQAPRGPPIAIHDETGAIVELSRGWTESSGYAKNEISSLFDWLGERCSAEFCERLAAIISQPPGSGETSSLEPIELTAKGGGTRHWQANVTLIGRFQDGRTVWLLIAVDLTESIRSNQALEQRTQELERSNRELDDFAYIASHDMKEPLRGIHNNALFLEEDFADQLGPDGARRIGRMKYLCKRLETLIDDLLYYSRIGRQALAIQQIDPNAIVADIARLLEGSAIAENARIVAPEPLPPCVCDAVRVQEVFRNLITNGLKYNNSPEKVVEVGFLEHRSGHRNVYFVRDNGFGIDPQFHQDVFRIFKRLNPEDDTAKGTGSGLTFVKKIVERHGGVVWVESTLGAGSTFYFTLGKPSQKQRQEKNHD